MTPERWQQVERIYQEAASRPPAERASFLDQACAGDVDLRGEVERILAGDSEAAGFLEAPAVEVAARALAADAARISPGSRLGPYEIVSFVGAGGMEEVYRARDTRLNRTVAIKVLPPLAADDAERRKRFLREARAASALNHPNIVTLHDIVSEDGRDSIIMEYVEGKTFADRIGRKGLPLPEALRYAIQIADALAAAGFDVRGLRTRLIAWMRAPAPSVRLAVLPFANLTGDAEQEYLSDGLTQEMISQLDRLHPQSLSVIARTPS